MTLLAVALGGALGAAARHLVDQELSRRLPGAWPWGTTVVNLLGSLALGLVLGTTSPGTAVAFLGTGLCGAFTTWSTLAVQAATLLRSRPAVAAAYVGVNLLGGLGLAALGLLATGALTT